MSQAVGLLDKLLGPLVEVGPLTKEPSVVEQQQRDREDTKDGRCNRQKRRDLRCGVRLGREAEVCP